MTAAIYARYSSDLQSEKSIEDQVRRCRALAAKSGAFPVEVFSDSALSGASMANRPGLQSLLRQLEDGRVSIVLTESLDRLSRDPADLHLIDRAIRIAGASLITAADGEIPDDATGVMQLGLRAILGQTYLRDLADKTRRGQIGVALEGRIAGGRCYGYRAVPGPVRGLREIDPEEAAIIVRIFEEYAEGRSARAIAKGLNKDDVPGPRSSGWRMTTIFGNAKRLTGILHQPLYRGEYVFNRQHRFKNPATGRCKMRPNPESEWKRVAAPELRIIDDDLWARVQARMEETSRAGAGRHAPKPSRPLVGLLRCGLCEGAVRTVSKGRYGCSNHRDRGTCSNGRTVAIEEIERRVFSGLTHRLLDPQAVDYAVRIYREHLSELEANRSNAEAAAKADIAKAQRSIDMAKRYFRDGQEPPQWLFEAANDAETRIRELRSSLESLEAPRVVSLHPEAAAEYRRLVAELNDALAATQHTKTGVQATRALRQLIDHITVSPGEKRGEVEIEIVGDLAALLVGNADPGTAGVMGAGVGFEPTTFRL